MKILPPVSIEARRLLPSRWDLLAAALVLGFIVAFADTSRLLTQPLSVISGDHLNLSPWFLPGYALRTGLRMLLAMIVSLAFTFSYATWAAKNPRAGTLLIPLLDILQSLPILGFLSVTVIWFALGCALCAVPSRQCAWQKLGAARAQHVHGAPATFDQDRSVSVSR